MRARSCHSIAWTPPPAPGCPRCRRWPACWSCKAETNSPSPGAEPRAGLDGRPGLTARAPWIVAFSFGLLHGFGFAGALNEIGLPEHAIPPALLFFNVGVELGQLVFIAAVLLAWAVLKRLSWPLWAWRVPVYAIGSMAAFWTIERIAGFA